VSDRPTAPAQPPATTTVAILGAGLAGLAAATTLLERGVDVQLLETRARVGGRVHTLRGQFPDGLWAEAGAEFISPGHQMMREFVARYGLRAVPRREGRRQYCFDGRVEPGERSWVRRAAARDAERLEAALAQLGAQVTDPTRAWETPDGEQLDRCSVQGWLESLGLGRSARAERTAWVTVDYGVEPKRLSLLMYARDERLIQQSPDLPSHCIEGGADQLPRAMAAQLGDRLHLATTATALREEQQAERIDYQQPDRSGSLRAELVILALPPPALRRLRIEPSFEPERAAALARLGFGSVLKMLVLCRRRFWRDLDLDGGMLTDRLGQAGYEATHSQPGERGILTVYSAGESARTLAGLSEQQRLAYCLEHLETLYPGCSGAVEAVVATTWDADPGSSGGYSHFRPGTLIEVAPWLIRPAGRLHFAGEHTDHWQATMNGALSSGVRAASEVLTRLGRA
jgi:monoamine oxidase